MKYFIGIDVSKDSFDYCIADGQCDAVKHGKCAMNREGFNAFKEILKNYTDCVIALESTGSYHTNLLSFLVSFKQEVCLINPVLINRFTQTMTLRKTKTDKADARIIAQFVRQNIQHLSYFQFSDYDEISGLARAREDLSKQIAKTKTQLKQQVNIVFPELLNEFNIFTNTVLQVLSNLPTTQVIRNTDTKSITCIINSIGGRRSNLSADRLKSLADTSIGKSSAQMEQIIQHYVEMLLFLMKKMDKLTDSFVYAVSNSSKDNMEIISSIKGISDITASHFLSEIKNINRFESKGSLIAYAGTDPSVKQSGTSLHRNGRISKKGSSSLRRYLYLMATGVMRSNPYFRTYYLKKREQGMQHRKAMIALCNKLLRVIFALLKNGEKFIMPNHYL